MTPELRERLAKIYELVKRGTDGEQANAKALLDKLVKKYNISESEYQVGFKKQYTFKYSTVLESKLLARICIVLLGYDDVFKDARKRTMNVREIVIPLDYGDYITVQCAYEYFRRHMKQQWNAVCKPELDRCRKAKTKREKQKSMELPFFNSYCIKSKLYKEGELQEIKFSDMSAKEFQDHMKMRSVQGGAYNKQMNTGNLIGNG